MLNAFIVEVDVGGSGLSPSTSNKIGYTDCAGSCFRLGEAFVAPCLALSRDKPFLLGKIGIPPMYQDTLIEHIVREVEQPVCHSHDFLEGLETPTHVHKALKYGKLKLSSEGILLIGADARKGELLVIPYENYYVTYFPKGKKLSIGDCRYFVHDTKPKLDGIVSLGLGMA